MPDRPLLLFPTPQLAERTKPKNRPFGQLHKPDVTKQGKRLSPMFAELQDAFEERKNMAKKYGEEAGTKLLLPMIIMLIVVMAIIMVPALMSFSGY